MSSSAAVVSAHSPLLDDDSISVVQHRSQNECEEEEYAVHDAEDPAGFQHRTILIQMKSQVVVIAYTHVAERA